MERWLAETEAEQPWNGIAGPKVITSTNLEHQAADKQDQKDTSESVMAQSGSTVRGVVSSSNADRGWL